MRTFHPIPSHLSADFNYCLEIVQKNSENFPVGSLLAPRRMRPHLHAIYAFARTADDFADLPGREDASRLNLLDDWARRLDRCQDGSPDHPIFRALQHTFESTGLTSAPFHELLIAFRMDVTHKRYETMAELEDYCRFSANPVGRIILHLADELEEASMVRMAEKIQNSDRICTALQLANHLQDLGQDSLSGRPLYLPRETLDRFGISEEMVLNRRFSPMLGSLVLEMVQQSRQRMIDGAPLVHQLHWPLSLEMAAIVEGGLAVLDKIEAWGGNTLRSRPRLEGRDRFRCLWRAILRLRS